MDEPLSLERIAELTGQPVEELRRSCQLGLLSTDTARPVSETVERVLLIRFVTQRGMPADELARLCHDQGDVLDAYVRQLARPGRAKTFTMEEVAGRVEVDARTLARLAVAAGMRDQEPLFEDDVAALELVAAALRAGLPEEALLQIMHVFAASLAKVAEAACRLFHFYVHERFRAEGLRGPELETATQGIADPLTSLLQPAVQYFFERAWERAVREDLLVHLREEASPPPATPGEVLRTVVFVDLSSFTPLSEAMGDAAAAEVLERFGELTRDIALCCDGEIVKQLGDGFMLTFADSDSARGCALELERQVAAEPRFPAVRMGAHTGTVLYRAGDYVGVNVNIAARVAAFAHAHQLLVTRAVRDQTTLVDIDYVSAGRHRLKGLGDEMELFAVRPGSPPLARATDPVCGMQLDDSTTEARVHWRDQQLGFCSPGCLKRFLEDPQRYITSA
jgi:class 3 adenylate cyclase/YHS domain-containing protein